MLSVRSLECKLRFGLSRLPFFPVVYSLRLDGQIIKRFLWTKVMPFFDQHHGLLHMELWGWDVPELRFLWRFCRPGMVFFDVGAHHGLYSLIAASRVGSSGRVVAFEPNPADARRIRWHGLLNRFFASLAPIRIESLALADQSGCQSFHIPVSGVRTTAALRKPNDSRSRFREISVHVDTLDDYLVSKGVDRLDLLKLDVEGAEMLFLDGARQALTTFRPLIIVEAIDDITHSWGHTARGLLQRISDEFLYEIFAFTDDGRLLPHRLLEFYPLISRCNYLAVPQGKIDSLIGPLLASASQDELS